MFTGDTELMTCLIPGIPNDIAINCIARLPLKDQRLPRFVSKAWFHVFSTGEIYEARKSLGLLQKTLIFFQSFFTNISNNYPSPEFPIMMYDLESETCQDLRPLYFCEGQSTLNHFISISSGPNMVILGESYCDTGAFPESPTHPVWILRGACGKWERMDVVRSGNCPCMFANMLDGEMFVGDVEALELETMPATKLRLRKFDMQRTWTTLEVPTLTLEGCHLICGSFVQHSKLHFLSSCNNDSPECHHVFDPKEGAWVKANITSNLEILDAGVSAFTTTRGTTFGVFSDRREGHEHEMLIMWYNERTEGFSVLSTLRRHERGRSDYYLESLDDTLFLIEVVFCPDEGCIKSGIFLSILKLTFGQTGVSGEWELKQKRIIPNYSDVCCCSVLEL